MSLADMVAYAQSSFLDSGTDAGTRRQLDGCGQLVGHGGEL
jgi:hypothetical protein